MATMRASDGPSDGAKRTCAEVATTGVHPVAIQALADLQSSLVRVTLSAHSKAEHHHTHNDVTTTTTPGEGSPPSSLSYSSRLTSTAPSGQISLADRATHFITSEFICRVTYEDLFVGAVNEGGCSPKLPPSRRMSTMHPSLRISLDASSPTTRPRAFDDGYRCINSNAELEVDDMLWVVDNRKLTPEQRKGWQEYLLAEQESYERQYQGTLANNGGVDHSNRGGSNNTAPWPPPPPPPSSSVPRDMHSNPTTATPQSSSSTLRKLNITMGAANPKQLSVLRRGVAATAQFLDAADREERDFQAEVQDIKEEEVRRYCERQAKELEERSKALSEMDDDRQHRPFARRQNNQLQSLSSSPTTPPSYTDEAAPSPPAKEEGGFFSRFKNNNESKPQKSESSSFGFKLKSVFENLTKKGPPRDENGVLLTQAAIDEAYIRRQLLMLCPPIYWRETLGLNIITQWTYTLTIAVVKYCLVFRDAETHEVVNRKRAKEANSRLAAAASVAGISGDGGEIVSSPVAPAPALGVTRAKELVVVRHVSKRVYGQPTKAQFHTKDHRSATGDVIDYPNIYFNVDDFDDDALFSDIKLCDGYTLAVLLTAGATRNSSAAIFRGALSYEIIMQRMKKHSKLFMGADSGLGGATRQGSTLGSSSFFDGPGSPTSQSSTGGAADVPKLFIPLIGPDKKGKAEMSVSIGDAERELSRQQQLFERQQALAESGLSSSEESGSKSSLFDSFASSSSKNGSNLDSGSFFNKLISNKSGGIVGDTGGAGSTATSIFSRQPTTTSITEEATLQGNEAIQCSLTFVSVHAQHVMDALTNTELERNRQWLTFPTSDEELTKILEMSAGV